MPSDVIYQGNPLEIDLPLLIIATGTPSKGG